MRSVEVHFSDPKERELALLVWRKGQDQLGKYEVRSGSGITKVFLANATLPNEKIMILASDWISVERGDGEEGSTEHVCATLDRPAKYFDANQIANVEHAYRAAFLSITLSPAVSFLAAGAWELISDPLFKEPAMRAYNASQGLEGAEFYKALARSLSKSYGLAKLKESYLRNGQQFFGADLTGWMMGADLWDEFASTGGQGGKTFTVEDARLAELRQQNGLKALNQLGSGSASPTPPPAAAGDTWPVTKRGTMLSEIAGIRYSDVTLWPLIWDNNRSIIGDNPNIVPVGITLKIRKKEEYSAQQIREAKGRSPSWRNYPTR